MRSLRKIAIFMQFKHFNGVAQVYRNLANGFALAGFEVDFIIRSHHPELTQRLSPEVNIVSLRTTSSNLLNLLLITLQLAYHLFNSRYQALIAGELLGSEMALAAHVLNFRRVPLVLIEHDGSALRHSSQYWSFPRRLFFREILRIHRLARALVAVSEGVREDMMHLTGMAKDHLRVIYNPVDLDDIQTRAKEVNSHPWFQNQDIPVVLTVSRLSPEKDITTLIEAFALVRKSHACRLMLVGTGVEQERLTEYVRNLGISQDVEFIGFAPNVYSLMAASTVFCLSSRSEGFGLVLVEAMACGCQVVSTDAKSGPREILKNGLFGSLVPVGDSKLLANALKNVLEGTIITKEKLLSRVEDFSLSKITEEYIKVIEETIS